MIDLAHGPKCKTAAETLIDLEKEIAWNERRLEILVLSDEDRQQTMDMVVELKKDRLHLLSVLERV